ncbi:hypothetical protein GALL_405770 [mine drainage metagenome]|uniref:Uncharacterized protein n=1 Tax=mine drainage metagenome TaxID=410659 RepID=A0A1J5QJP3_9ZZZZ
MPSGSASSAAPMVTDARAMPAQASDRVTSWARRTPIDGAAPMPRDPSTCATRRTRSVRLRATATSGRSSQAASEPSPAVAASGTPVWRCSMSAVSSAAPPAVVDPAVVDPAVVDPAVSGSTERPYAPTGIHPARTSRTPMATCSGRDDIEGRLGA